MSYFIEEDYEGLDTEALRLAVKKGAYVLDQRQPGWRDQVQILSLDLASECRCVLGQLNLGQVENRPYACSVWALRGIEPDEDDANEKFTDADYIWAREHGFDRELSLGYKGYAALTALWRDAIEEG